ncbi:MAG: glycosyltransferase, partial [Bdellovibrionales bacterium]
SIDLVIVDGASTDSTLEIVRSFTKLPITLLSEKDSGTSEAINKGVKLAKGELVTLLMADDRFATSGTLSRAARVFMQDPELDMLFTTGRVYDPNGLVPTREFPSDRANLRRRVSLNLPGGFFKVRSLDPVMMDTRYKIANDYEFVCRHVIDRQLKIRTIPDVTVVMRLGGMSGDYRNDFLHSWEKFKIRKHYFGLPYATALAAVAFSVSLLRRLHFRPYSWVRRLKRTLRISSYSA